MRQCRVRREILRVLSLAALTAAASLTASADERPACERFDWPLAVEAAWFADPALPFVPTGAKLDAIPARGISLELKPAAEVRLEPPPSRGPRAEKPMSGIVSFPVSARGTYQVTISADGWVDAVQEGVIAQATSHTGNRECVGLRKSVRFNLAQGLVAIHISGASTPAMRIAIRHLD